THALHEESGRNPFYLEQLARVRNNRHVNAAPSGAEISMAGVDVPPMVAAALAEELALLPASARRVLDGAAVAGDPFALDLAASAAAATEREALDALDVLGRLAFIRPGDMPRRFR